MTPPRPVEVLLVEDNAADAMLTAEAFHDPDVEHNLRVVKDGIEAMSYLRRMGAYAGAPRPDLVLLDLNLPRKDGRQVLAEIKADDDLATIPVVILSSSRHEKDIAAAYGLHANAYVHKPIELHQFMEAIRVTKEYWFSIVTLPSRRD